MHYSIYRVVVALPELPYRADCPQWHELMAQRVLHFRAFIMEMFLQLVQEMEIIINKPDIYKSFSLEWKDKWAPAILSYARKLKRREVVTIVRDYDSKEGVQLIFCVNSLMTFLDYIYYRERFSAEVCTLSSL